RRGGDHASVRADLLGPAAADAVDALQADPHVLVDRQIDTRDARHDVLSPMRFVRGKRAILTLNTPTGKPCGARRRRIPFQGLLSRSPSSHQLRRRLAFLSRLSYW